MSLLRSERQRTAFQWAVDTFGDIARKPNERIQRFIEEALELAQAHGVSQDTVLKLVDYVYHRPTGVIFQEIGGVSITLLTYCESIGYSADHAEVIELARILTLDPVKLRAKQNTKAEAGVALHTEDKA